MQLQVFLDAMVAVPGVLATGRAAARVDLYEAHTAFDEPPRGQALASEGGRTLGQWVPGGFGFLDAVGL